MADALTKLAIVEERQTQTILAQERAFKALERVEERQRQQELQCRDQEKVRQLIADSNERLSIRVASWKRQSPCKPRQAMGHGGRVGRSGHAGIVHRAAHLSGCSSEPRKARRQNRRRRNSSCRAAGHALRGHGVAEKLPRPSASDRVRGAKPGRSSAHGPAPLTQPAVRGHGLGTAYTQTRRGAVDCIKHQLTDGQRPRS